jgi:hypothetical protein
MFAGVALYALLANACYCLGWVTELLWSGGDTSRTAPLRARVFRAGILFSVGVTLLPAVLLPILWAIFGVGHASSQHATPIDVPRLRP